MAKKIRFTAHFGDETKPVTLLQYWGDTYYVIVDTRQWGEVSKRNGVWTGDISPFGEMCFEDIAIIGAIIDENYPNGNDVQFLY
jgi:hypothetical protein